MLSVLGSTFGGGGDLSSLSLISGTHNPNNSTAQVTAPSSNINAGDLLIIQEYGPDVSSNINGNIPSGFTKIVDSEHAAVDHRVHYKIAAGNEASTTYYGQTGSNEDMSLFVFRGDKAITSVTVDQTNSTDNTNYPSTTLFSLNTTTSTLVFFGCGSRSSDNCYFSSQTPSGIWTNYNHLNTGNSNEVEAFSWYFNANGVSGSHSMQMTSSSASRQTILAAALTLGT